jgi:hypothetical protein
MALRLPRFLARSAAPRPTLRDRLRVATAKILPFRRPVAEAPGTDAGRRAIMLGGAATAAVLPLPAFGGGDGGGSHADAYLITLGQAFADAAAKAAAAQADFLDRVHRYTLATPVAPAELARADGTFWTVGLLEQLPAGDATAAALLPSARDHETRDDRIAADVDLTGADQRLRDSAEHALSIGREIADMAAHTLDGLAVKARVLQALGAELAHYPAPKWQAALVTGIADGVVTLAHPASVVTLDADPIYPAIETHRAAYAAWDRVLDVSAKLSADDESDEAEEWRRRDVEHADREMEAFGGLIETVPTTAPGVAALVSYVRTIPAARDHMEVEDMMTLLDTLNTGLARVQAGA